MLNVSHTLLLIHINDDDKYYILKYFFSIVAIMQSYL